MRQKIIGRKQEQRDFGVWRDSGKPEFIAVYGRRRIGKTFLVKQFFNNKFDFYITGAYNASRKDQLFNFKMTLQQFSGKSRKTPSSWLEAFFQLQEYLGSLGNRRKFVFIDELPWFDTPRSNFISAIELFWNQWASDQNIMLIVCGSATSWMVNKLLGDKGGLHNRVTHSMYLAPFTLGETEEFLKYNGVVFNRHQVTECYMMLGGTPYYLNMLRPDQSLPQNINRLFFGETAELRREFDFLFRSLFKDSDVYRKVVEILSKNSVGMTRKQIVEAGKLNDGGKLSEVIDELCNCDFIKRFRSFHKKEREVVYQLTDLFSLFYIKYVKDANDMDETLWTDIIDSPSHRTWTGYAFEQVCLHHIRQIKQALGISGIQCSICSWQTASRVDSDRNKHGGGQIDLVIDRRDQTINLCEMKFSMGKYEITPQYIRHLTDRRELFRRTTGTSKALHLTMVTTYGIAHNAQSGMIQSEVTMADLFRDQLLK